MPFRGSPASLVAPGRGQGSGAATIIPGSNNSQINIWQQSERLRAASARATALAKQKDATERFKQMQIGVKIDDNTSPIYQPEYSKQVAGVKQGVVPLYNDRDPNYVADPFQRQQEVDKRVSGVSAYKRMADDDWVVGKQMQATAKGDAELDGAAYAEAWNNAHYEGGDPTKRLLRPDELENGYHEKLLNDPRFIKAAVATDNFFDKVPGSQEYLTVQKGKPGTYSTTDDLMTKLALIEPDGKGGHQVKLENGRPVLRDPAGLLLAMKGTKFGKLVDNDMAEYNAKRAQVQQKMANYDPLTPEERQFMEPKTKLDFLTDRALGHVVVKSKEERAYIRMPQPRAAAAGGAAGFVAPSGKLVQGDYQANLANPDEVYTSPVDLNAPGLPKSIVGSTSQPAAPTRSFPHLGESEPPMLRAKGGKVTEITAKAARFPSYFTDDGKGNFVEVPNNNTAQAGTYGKSFVVPTDKATGKPLFRASRQEQQQAVREGRATPQLYFEFTADKNASFGRDYQAKLEELVAHNDELETDKQQPLPVLEGKAQKLASQGISRQLVPYNPQTAQIADGPTNGHYRAALRAAQQLGGSLRTPAPATKSNTTSGKTTGINW